MTHSIKILPVYFSTIRDGLKPFEDIIFHKRFKIGSTFIFREWSGTEYTGREITFSSSNPSDGKVICHIEYIF